MGRLVVLVTLVAALAWPAASFAASGQLDNGTMVYTAGNGESNNVTLTLADDGFGNFFYLVVDTPVVQIAPTPPCENGFNGETNQMKCPVNGGGQPPPLSFAASLGDGNDSITLVADIPTSIGAGGGKDTITGGPAADFLRGGQQDDTITGGTGNDQLVGDDPGVVGGGNDSLDGGEGNDSADGQDGADTIRGGNGDDVLAGGAGNDSFPAEAGSDGADVLNGNDGVDTATYAPRTAPLQLSLDDQPNDGLVGSAADNVHSDVENLVGGSAGDSLSGSAAPNTLDGGAGDDGITGADGDDALIGAAGNDTTFGGAGNDNADGGDGNDTLGGDSGDDVLTGGPGNDVETGGEGGDALDGGDGDDSMDAGPSADTLQGGPGNDAENGGDGGDLVDGGAGDDLLDGGSGPDVIEGGDGVDTGDYSSRAAPVAVALDDKPGDGEAGEGDNVGSSTENLRGGSGGDTFVGSAVANTLDGGAGEDYSDGGAGSDSLIGGDAGDVLRTRGSAEPDNVTCGPGPDFVVAKAADTIAADCDRADRGVNQKPKRRDSAVIAPVSGTLQMSPTGIVRRVPLQDKVVLPLRSIVDTVAGVVKVTSAATTRKIQTISLDHGAFDITQTAAKTSITQFALQGGDFGVCPTAAGRRASAAAGSKKASTKTVRVLWAKGKGNFRTKGRYAAASIRGTRWETIDRCDGTLVKVTQGVVNVKDLVKKKTVAVRAGDSYLAKR